MTAGADAENARSASRQRARQDSARLVLTVAAVLAGFSVVAWIVLAATDTGTVHGLALAASAGAPLAAVGLAGAALYAHYTHH
ncbi:MAG: hypothetical protein INR66_03605 [Gordonia polyisoprenivorans]|nr:hypothetical protein [Gordonia polyisoprenivorans]